MQGGVVLITWNGDDDGGPKIRDSGWQEHLEGIYLHMYAHIMLYSNNQVYMAPNDNALAILLLFSVIFLSNNSFFFYLRTYYVQYLAHHLPKFSYLTWHHALGYVCLNCIYTSCTAIRS